MYNLKVSISALANTCSTDQSTAQWCCKCPSIAHEAGTER